MPDIYVDADACPVKDEILKVASRHGLEVYVVSNGGWRGSVAPRVHPILVDGGLDAADRWIAEHVKEKDIVVTADIPLAAAVLDKGALAVAPNGRRFTADGIGEALALRALNAYRREAGEIAGRHAPFGAKDRSRFLQTLEEMVQALRRGA